MQCDDSLGQVTLFSQEKPSVRLQACARKMRVGLAWGDAAQVAGRPLVLVGTGGDEALGEGMTSPFAGFFELDADGGVGDVHARCLQVVRHGGLVASLSTRTAFSCNLVGLFAAAMRARCDGLSPDLGDNLEMSLAEAVGNAVVHGNLGVGSGLRANREDFALYCEQLRVRMEDRILSSRRVDVTWLPDGRGGCCLTVTDRGAGFDLNAQLADVVGLESKSGRGLPLIKMLSQSVASADGGRTLVMTF